MGDWMSAGLVMRESHAELLGGHKSKSLRVALMWRADDPYAVELRFSGCRPDGDVRWWIARELLAEGMYVPAGVGDVHVQPSPSDPAMTLLALSPGERQTRLDFGTDDLAEFLEATYELVPLGAEYDPDELDDEIFLLLLSEGRSE